MSLVTMLRAIHLLRHRGVLSVKHGSGCFFLDGSAPALPPRSATVLRDSLWNAIAQGELRRGQPLPKLDHFCRTHSLSSATVCEALKLLRDDNTIHKEGKKWIAGPALRQSFRTRNPDEYRPTVVVLLPQRHLWEFFCTHPYVSSFTHELLSELDAHRIRHEVAFEKGEESGGIHLCGPDAVLERVRHLGRDFLGLLICGEITDFDNLDLWISLLRPSEVPVAWFDFSFRGVTHDRRRFPRVRYYHLHPDEHAAVTLALSALHDAGHRTVGVPVCARFGLAGWQHQRIDLITSVAQSFQPPFSVVVRQQSERWWPDTEEFAGEAMPAFCSRCEKGILRKSTDGELPLIRFREELQNTIPSLASLAGDHRITAVVAPNDILGVNYYYFFSKTGLAIPRDLSMVSFDNRMSFHHYPLSSVDFGYGDLGYRAAQLFIGDVPVSADSRGNMASRPQLFDRGSISSPRRR